MIKSKGSQLNSDPSDIDRQARLLMGKQVFCLFLILAIIMIPFITTDYYYSFKSDCRSAKSTNTYLDVPLSVFLQVKASTDVAYVVFILLTSIIILMTERYQCFLKAYGYILLFLGLLRLGWMIVGSIMFWGSIFKRGVCTTGENAYIWIDLIIGYVTVVLNFLTTKSPAA